MRMRNLWWPALCACAVLGLSACEEKGPLEQAGEEVDEAIDTAKRGGEESAETRADDAMDEVREGANEVKEEAQNE